MVKPLGLFLVLQLNILFSLLVELKVLLTALDHVFHVVEPLVTNPEDLAEQARFGVLRLLAQVAVVEVEERLVLAHYLVEKLLCVLQVGDSFFSFTNSSKVFIESLRSLGPKTEG